MSYQARETSVDSGIPVELYYFTYSGMEWCHTNSSTAIVHDNKTYVPIPIMRSAINSPGDLDKSSLDITTIADHPVASFFAQYPPSEPITVTVYGHHILDNEFAVIWKGRILSADWDDSQQVKMRSESVFTSLQRPGLGRTYQTQCPFALYGARCGVSNIAYRDMLVVSAVNGREVTLNNSRPLNYYAGGYATWANSVTGVTERRAVKESTADGKITLSSYPIGLVVGSRIDVFAGCDHTLNGDNGCTVKFLNHVRFGGTPWQPDKNPFGGSTIF